MTKKFWIAIALVVAAILAVVLLSGRGDGELQDTSNTAENGSQNMDEGNNKEEDVVDPQSEAQISRVLGRLPRTLSIGQRSVILDRETVVASARSEFSPRTATTLVQRGDDPVAYIERIIRTRLERQEVKSQPEFFEFAASLYPEDDRVVAFLNTANMPDDSVGQSEERFEFVYAGGAWGLDWYGARNFCSRPIPGKWQPADELCP